MRLPLIQTISAVARNRRLDHRTKRLATHFRYYFRCLDRNGDLTDNEEEIERVELTQRGKELLDKSKKKL